MVVDEAEEMGATLLAGPIGIRQPGTEHGVPLPQVIHARALEAAVSLHLLSEQTTGLAPLTEMGGQSVDVYGLVEAKGWGALKDVDQGPSSPGGLLLAQGDGLFDQVGREGARFPLVSTGLGTQGVEAAFTVELEVAAQGGHADAGARGGGDGVGLGSDLAQASLLPAWPRPVVDQGCNEAIPEQRNFGVQVAACGFGRRFGTHLFAPECDMGPLFDPQ